MYTHHRFAALLALSLTACASTPDADRCQIARMDVAAAEACLAEPACRAKWDSDLFRAQLADNRDIAARCEAAR